MNLANQLNRWLFISVTAFLFSFSNIFAQAPFVVTHIPSDAGGETGVAVKIVKPLVQRYPDGAPVVVYVEGGTKGEGLDVNGVNVVFQGFIELSFNFPGSGVAEDESGGTYDLRGPECLKAMRDVVRFAMGEIQDQDGKNLAQLVGPIKPMPGNVGMVGLSHGGNAVIATAGVYGDEISSLAWIVNYESPVGDGMPTLEAGSNGSSLNPVVNPAYDPDSDEFDLSLLAYDDTASINQNHAFRYLGEFHGGLYFDINQNGVVDVGVDFIALPFIYEVDDTLKAFYSVRLMQEATTRDVLPENPPAHIPTLAQTEEFWYWRDGENWIESAVQIIPGLMFLVEASETDHAQSATDHPHVLMQYQGFLAAGARFVRLNPDRAYVEQTLGRAAPTVADNDAFAEFDHQSIRTALEPPRQGGYQIDITVNAAACELADRTHYDDLSPQLEHTISTIERSSALPTDFALYQNWPNPFNASTRIEYHLPSATHVRVLIYNHLGQRIRTLSDQQQRPGFHAAVWDGKTDTGENGASGIYFYRLVSDANNTHIKKMLLIK